MNYREGLKKTLVGYEDRATLLHAALGLAGEAGEFVDSFKKHHIYGKPLDRAHCLEELGDIRWYLELALIELGSSIEEIERLNIEKLKKRYPKGFEE